MEPRHHSYACDKRVKALIPNHTKCTKHSQNKVIQGKFINALIKNDVLIPDHPYPVCKNVYYRCKDLKPRVHKRRRENVSPPPSSIEQLTREKRAFRRERKKDPIEISKLQKVFVKYKGRKNINVDEHELYINVKGKERVMRSIMDLNEKHRKPFQRIHWKYRNERIENAALHVLNACIDRMELQKEGLNYLECNEELAVVVCNFIDLMKEKISQLLRISLNHVADQVIKAEEEDKIDLDEKMKKLSTDLFARTSKHQYNHLVKLVNDIAPSKLPSYIQMKNGRAVDVKEFKINPLIESQNILSHSNYAATYYNDSVFTSAMDDGLFDDEYYHDSTSNSQSVPPEIIMVVGTDNAEEDDEQVMGAKLDLSYEKVIKHLIETNDSHKSLSQSQTEKMIVIDSFDGAEHVKSKKDVTSVISFNTTALSRKLLTDNKSKTTTTSSSNIITWQQVMSQEKLPVLIGSLKDHYKEKAQLVSNHSNFHYYDLHDLKMSYLLTQHSLWSRNNHPFLLCSCNRGEGVKNSEHVCKLVSDDEQVYYYNRSLRRYQRQLRLMEYTYAMHVEWCAKYNKGITHFGVSPTELRRSHIRIDTFHMKCSITRTIMSFIRKYILAQPQNVIDDFNNKVLKSFWGKYQISIWNSGKSFSSFIGKELSLFVSNAEAITTFITSRISSCPAQNSIVRAMAVLPQIFRFCGIIEIENHDEYMMDVYNFILNVKELYAAGSNSFLTRFGENGDAETIYMHALRFYIPWIIEDTYNKFGLGIGIWTMQGFERRNKESKETVTRHCNRKGNILLNNIAKLLDKLK